MKKRKAQEKNLKVVPKEKTHKAKKLPQELDRRKSSGQNASYYQKRR